MFREDDPKSVERYSSAITLSDMEIFIFPELLFSLVLANIMSPRLWQWRSDPWFSGVSKLPAARRIQRLKQYIMDHFSFNLDLDTWGLTTKERELARFAPFIAPEVIAESNALFGYEGDKYYFEQDIRKHFGLDKYTSNVIPYWKTETIEAMEAFRHKPGYAVGAGECVSLATLYAAAAFVVIGIPLEEIFLLATPLHSQNFLDVGSGILTNNRRIVTKTMWFNGTELSAKARRALENEQVTIVTNHTGLVHTLYPVATIDEESYNRFGIRLGSFLSCDRIDFEILANFLRCKSQLQRCFQIKHVRFDRPRYIEAETVFAYEHSSKARVSDASREALLQEIEEDEYYPAPIPGRLHLDEFEDFFKTTRVSLDEPATLDKLKAHLPHCCMNVEQVMHDLKAFCRTAPRLPEASGKQFVKVPQVDLNGVTSAGEAALRIEALRASNESADLAFAAFRDLSRSPWKPFVKAAIERNPVSANALRDESFDAAYTRLVELPGESIYDEMTRIAQPDEVWNFGRGDGAEKALTLANIIRAREPEARFAMEKSGNEVVLKHTGGKSYSFTSGKSVEMPTEKDFEL
jgi:hypothetical protein